MKKPPSNVRRPKNFKAPSPNMSSSSDIRARELMGPMKRAQKGEDSPTLIEDAKRKDADSTLPTQGRNKDVKENTLLHKLLQEINRIKEEKEEIERKKKEEERKKCIGLEEKYTTHSHELLEAETALPTQRDSKDLVEIAP